MDAIVIQEICEDPNFKQIADDKTNLEEFAQLLQSHVGGYSHKKRLCDGLKEFIKKVEDAENKLYVAKNVGKFKAPDEEILALTNVYTSLALKEKWSHVNGQLQTMIDDGSITHFEKPHVIENLRSRLEKAKEAGKTKLEEKLDSMLTHVIKAGAFTLPVGNLEQFFQLDKEIQAIEKLKKLNAKNLTADLRERIENKEVIEGDLDTLIDTSRMWFETAIEFKSRLHEALIAYLAAAEERKRQEEEQALEKKIREDSEAFEKKRVEEARKQAEIDRKLEEKLAAKRLEAAAKPVKEVPKAQPKEKKVAAKLDIASMFHEAVVYEEVNPYEIMEDLKAAEERKKNPGKPIPKPAEYIPPAAKEPPKPVVPKKTEEEKFAEIEAKLAAKRLESESKPAKEPPQPKKKDKKPAATKMSLLDFYSEDLVLSKLAAQEEEEKIEKAARQAEAEKEAARLAAEAEATWAAEEAAWNAYEEEKTATRAAPARTAPAPVVIANPAVSTVIKPEPEAPRSKPKPNPKPVARESKWGAPVEQAGLDDDVLEQLAAREILERAAAKKAAEEEAQQKAEEENELWAEEEDDVPKKNTRPPVASVPSPSVSKNASAVCPTLLAARVDEPKPKPRAKPVEVESKWGAPTPEPALEQQEEEKEAGDDAEKESAPTLAESLKVQPVKKSAPPQPKKKEKKKWGKVDAGLIGFDADNLNM